MSSEKCNKEVYENGSSVFLTHTMAAEHVEEWVQAVAKESGQKVDWHYFGGRANILALGDLEKVQKAMRKLRSMHDDYYRQASSQFKFGSTEETELIINGIWDYNGLA